MIMSNALSGLANITSLVKRNGTTDSAAVAGKAATAAQALLPTQTAAMREVVSHYDMTDITPNDFSKLIQQLSAKGAISQKDTQELSSIRVDLENAGVNSDESVNLLQFYQQQIAKAQAAAAQSPNAGAAQTEPRRPRRAIDLGTEVLRLGATGLRERGRRGGVNLASPDFP